MEINDRVYICQLIDIYGKLLTKTQLDIMKDYYMFDLSFSEIGEQRNISRSAVSDTISKASAKILGFEEELCILKNSEKRKEIILSLKGKIDKETYKKLLELM